MRNLTKTVIAVASLICGATAANAQTAAPAPAPDWVLSATITGTTDYRFRGVSQDANQFTPQGSVTLTGPDGRFVLHVPAALDGVVVKTAAAGTVEVDQ